MGLEIAPYMARRYIELSFELNELGSFFTSDTMHRSLKAEKLILIGDLTHVIAETYTVRSAIIMADRPFDEFFERREHAILILERFNKLLTEAVAFAREAGFAADSQLFSHDANLVSLELNDLRRAVRQLTSTHMTMQKHLEAVAARIQHHTKTLYGYTELQVRSNYVLKAARDDYFNHPTAENLRAYMLKAEEKSKQIDEFAVSRYRDGVTPQVEAFDRRDDVVFDELIRDELLTYVLEQGEAESDVR